MWETASGKYQKCVQPEMKDENGDDVHTYNNNTFEDVRTIGKQNNNYYDSLYFRFVI